MNEKWNNGLDKIFRSSYSNDKYDKYDYNKLLKDITYDDFLSGYSDWNTYKPKKNETPQEREARLLREKAKVREEKIDLILKK